MANFGSQSMVGPLKRVLMRAPGKALFTADKALWHYDAALDPAKATAQFQGFADLVAATGARIDWIADADDGLADSIFTHDPSLVTGRGAVLLSMGKALRRAEVAAHEAAYAAAGVPILGRIEAPGMIEGGDCCWLDDRLLAVARGVRTNQSGIEQLRRLLAPLGIEVLSFDLPLWQGRAACLHMMSVISPLDQDLALIHSPLMPVAFHDLLTSRGVNLIEADPDEFAASNGLALNVLATAPRKIIMLSGFPKTKAAMEAAGCEVATFDGDALCIPCEGGPTCLTRPVWRA
ncbi:MAG: amidinotransferase [Hyphomicrobiaceae bacterium]|nr:amidinotransferase [Hyphomicrobiaceae bacterium]